MKGRVRSGVALAVCAGKLGKVAPKELLLLPAGEFRARDGRPRDVPSWVTNGEAAAAIIAKAKDAIGDFVIDYEHQTLLAEENGQPAPAAGWYKEFEWRDDGLWAIDVRWTEKARSMIEAEEYRYLSPVFEYDKKTGVVLSVLMAALTNYPAIDGHADMAARAAARFTNTNENEEDVMNREKMIALLGLGNDATDAQIEQAMTALRAKADMVVGQEAEIAALKKESGKVDPAKFVPVETLEALKGEVAALKAGQTAGEVAAMVDKGIVDGKLLPVQKDWATELGNKDVAALKSYLEKTPSIKALGGSQSGGKQPEGNDNGAELSADEIAVCRNLGISAEEYKKANNL